jgi:hypothetical protein
MGQDTKSEIVVTVRPVYPRTTSDDSAMLKGLSTSGDDETKSQVSSVLSLEDLETGKSKTKWHRRGGMNNLKRWYGARDAWKNGKRSDWCQLVLLVIAMLGFFCIIAAM